MTQAELVALVAAILEAGDRARSPEVDNGHGYVSRAGLYLVAAGWQDTAPADPPRVTLYTANWQAEPAREKIPSCGRCGVGWKYAGGGNADGGRATWDYQPACGCWRDGRRP